MKRLLNLKKILPAIFLGVVFLWLREGVSQCPIFSRSPSSARVCVSTTSFVAFPAEVTNAQTLSWEVYKKTDGRWGWVDLSVPNAQPVGANWSGLNTNTLSLRFNGGSLSNFDNLQIRCKATPGPACLRQDGTPNTEPVYSTPAGITFNVSPTLIPPSSRAICEGSPLDLVALPSGGGPYTYTWMKGSYRVGGDSAVFLMKRVRTSDSGPYTVKVENVCRDAAQASFSITVLESHAPSFQTQPEAAVAACDNGVVSFKALAVITPAGATVAEPAAGIYKWRYRPAGGNEDSWQDVTSVFQGVQAYGFDGAELRLSRLPIALSGYQFKCCFYPQCVVPGGMSMIETSPAATLTVRPVPIISRQLVPVKVCSGGNFMLTVEMNPPNGDYTYSWKKDNIALSGTNGNSWGIVAGAAANNTGTYEVVISNSCGSAKSATSVTVNDQLENEDLTVGGTLIVPPPSGGPAYTESVCSLLGYEPFFSVNATSANSKGPYTSSWTRNASPLGKTPLVLNKFDALLLDVVSVDSKLAYSLRRLRTGYGGSAVKVRRVSDQETREIGFTLAGVIDAEAFKTFISFGTPNSTRAYVSIWYDQSGNGYNAVQTVAASQPELILSNSGLEVKFDGVDDFLDVQKKIGDLIVLGTAPVDPSGAVFAVMKSAAGTPSALGVQDEAGGNWRGNPLSADGRASFSVGSSAATTAANSSGVLAEAWGQFTFGRSTALITVRTLRVERVSGNSNGQTNFSDITFTLGKANGMGAKNCSMKEFIMYSQSMAGRDLNSLEVSQAAYFNIWSGNMTAAGDLNLASDYNYQGGNTSATGFLDASCAPYSVAGKLPSGGALIRPFIPTDLGTQLKQWIDFTDESTLEFDSPPLNPANRTFSRARDKSNNGNDYSNLGGLSRSPRFANGRMESWDNGKGMTTNYGLSTQNGWAFFGVAGYTLGATRRQRIFDGASPRNILFGFHSLAAGGIFWAGNPDAYTPGLPLDYGMHVFSARQNSATDDNTPPPMIQDWYKTITKSMTNSAPLEGARITINSGTYQNTEYTDSFAVNEIIATDGNLSDDDYEKMRAYTAHHAGITEKLPISSPYISGRPLFSPPPSEDANPIEYRLAVANACNTVTKVIRVIVGACNNPIIPSSGQPKDQYACVGGKVTFDVKAQNAASYKWQYSTASAPPPEASWRDFDSAPIGRISPGAAPVASGNSSGGIGWRTDGNFVIGTKFIVSRPVTVTHIGAMRKNGQTVRDCKMGIWLFSAASPLLVSVNMSSLTPSRVGTLGAGSATEGFEIIYVPLPAPLSLNPGTYVMGRQLLNNEHFLSFENSNTLEVNDARLGIDFSTAVWRNNIPNDIFFPAPTGPKNTNTWFTTMIKVIAPPAGDHAVYSGTSGPSLTISNIPVLQTATYYRCMVSGGGGGVLRSNPVKFTLNAAIEVNAASPLPPSYEICKGNSISLPFSLNAVPITVQGTTISDPGPVTFVWRRTSVGPIVIRMGEVRRVTVNVLNDIYSEAGLTGDNPATSGYDNIIHRYEVTASNACTSPTAPTRATTVVSVSPELPKITANPSDLNTCSSANPAFTAASGTLPAPDFRWSVSRQTGWVPMSDNQVVTGTSTSTLRFANPSRISYDNQQYRCSLKNGCGEGFTNPATLSVRAAAPALSDIDANRLTDLRLCIPPDLPINTAIGAFAVEGAKNAKDYRWVKVVNGLPVYGSGELEGVPGVVLGVRTNRLTFYSPIAANLNHATYRCILTNACVQAGAAPVQTNDVTLVLNTAPHAAEPSRADSSLCAGDMSRAIPIDIRSAPPAVPSSLNPPGTMYFWMNDSVAETGLPANGYGTALPFFQASAYSASAPIIDEIRVIPVNGACVGGKNTGGLPAGKKYMTVTVYPAPTLTADILPAEICSSRNANEEKVQLKLTNQPSRVPDTRFTWEVKSQLDIINGTSPVRPVTGTFIADRNNIPGDASGIHSDKGSLINEDSNPIKVTYKVYPSISPNPIVWISPPAGNTLIPLVCKGLSKELVVTVKPNPTVSIANQPPEQFPNLPSSKPAFCFGEQTAPIDFTGAPRNVGGTIFNWTNEKSTIGLSDPGEPRGIPSFAADNKSRDLIVSTITVTPTAGGCAGVPRSFTITTAPKPSLNVSSYVPSLCSHDSPDIFMDASPGNVANTVARWSVSYPPDLISGDLGLRSEPNGVTLPIPPPDPSARPIISGPLTSTSNKAETVVYSITPIANQCAGDTKSITVNVNPKPAVQTQPVSYEMCSGDYTSIPLNSANHVENTFYTWTVSQNTNGASAQTTIGVPGPISQRLTALNENESVVTYTITPQANGCNGDPVPKTVQINLLPVVSASVTPPAATSPAKVCQGQPLNIALSSSGANSAKYTWTLQRFAVIGGSEQPAPTNRNSINESFTLPSAIDGRVTYTISAISDKNCPSPNKATVSLNVIHGPVALNTIPDKLYCDDGFLELAVQAESENSSFTMQWQEWRNDRNSWQPLTEASPYFGVNTNVLLINPAGGEISGFKYRLAMTDNICPAAYSNAVAVASIFAGSSASATSNTQINYGDKVSFAFNRPPDNTAYKWNFNDGWTSSLQNPEHFFYPPISMEGPYHVTVEAYANNFLCKKLFNITPDIQVERPPGAGGDVITETLRSGVTAYPAPFTDQLMVKSDKEMDRLSLIDMRGSVVMRLSLNGAKETSLQTGNLSSGIYIVRIWNRQGEYSIKVTKE